MNITDKIPQVCSVRGFLSSAVTENSTDLIPNNINY